MVYDLVTLKRLNKEADEKAKTRPAERPREKVPERIALNPAAAKAFLNRPWTKDELGSKPDLVASYAASEREPFKSREGGSEGLRP
jgi:hypothetical protein